MSLDDLLADRDDLVERADMLREAQRLRYHRARVMRSFQMPAVWAGVFWNLTGYTVAGMVATAIGLALCVPLTVNFRRSRRTSAAIMGLHAARIALVLAETQRRLDEIADGYGR